jgi:hypothetical protein
MHILHTTHCFVAPGNPADRSFRMSSHSYSPYDCLLVKTCNCKTRLASENAHDLSKPIDELSDDSSLKSSITNV